MKTRFQSNAALAHEWANNDAENVYKSASSLSCHFDILYSYNTAIAQIHGDSVILNNYSYSNSTSKHQHLAYDASRQYNQIFLSFGQYNLKRLIFNQQEFNDFVKHYNEQKANDLLVKASRSRKWGALYINQAIEIFRNLKKYADLLDLDYQVRDLSEYQQIAIEAETKRKELEKKEKEARIIKQAENLIKWRNGESVNTYFEVTALRVKDDTIETTKGARIPLADAIEKWPILKLIHEKGMRQFNHVIKLGNYTLNRIEGNNLIVGCHTIPFNEVESIAHQLNLA